MLRERGKEGPAPGAMWKLQQRKPKRIENISRGLGKKRRMTTEVSHRREMSSQ